MKRLSLLWLLLFLFLLIPQEVKAAEENYFENPTHIYEQFQDEIYNEEYTVKYGFAREAANAYTDWYGSAVAGKVEKFTGLIIVSETESYIQVIYHKGDSYAIGWIEQAFYQEEVRLYNGAEKQLLGDGIYEMTSWEKDRTYYLELTFEGDQQYFIRSIKADAYLDVVYDEDGIVTGLCWADKADTDSQRWQLIREYDSFYVKNKATGMYLVPRGEKSLGLTPILTELTNNFTKEGIQEAYHTATWTFARKFNNNVDPYRNFLQYDPDWGSQDYGPVDGDYSGKMAAAGCGVVSITNMTYALTGQFLDPMALADFAVEERYRVVGSGTDDGIFEAVAAEFGEAYGFRFVKRCYTTYEMRNYLRQGCVAISYVPGHYVTVADYNEVDKTYLVLDSHPIPRRPTSPYGDWFQGETLETGGLNSACYYIFEKR